MPLKRLARLAASAGVTAGLAFGGLATVGTTSADAATSTSTAFYDCTTPLSTIAALGNVLPVNVLATLGSFRVPATLSLDTLDDALLANVPVPAGLPFTTTLDFSAAGLVPSLVALLNGAVTTTLGTAGLGALNPTVTNVLTQLSNGSAVITSQLGSFTPTGTGSLPLPIPTSLNFGLLSGALGGLGINCTLDRSSATSTGGTIGSYTVVKQGANIKAHAKKKGHKTVLTVKVKTSAGQKGVGSIVAKYKGVKAKTKALANGKTKIVLKKLKKGKNKVKLSYSGNSYTNPAAKKVTVKVAR